MKQAFTIILIFAFLPFYLVAQQWAAPGTEWNFVQKIIFGGEIIPTKIKVTDQFLLNGFLVSQLEIENDLGCGILGGPDILTYSTPDGKVYFKEPEDSDFKILYDFQADEGETWTIPFTKGLQNEIVTYTVENVSIVDVEGSPRRQLQCSVTFSTGILWAHDEHATIVEGVGDLLYLFPWQTKNCDEGVMVGLCNYSDEEIDSYRPYLDLECVAGVSVKEIADQDFFEVSPNPANHILNIRVPESAPAIVPFTIYDPQGKAIHQGQINNNSVLELSISEWTAGLYFIRSNFGEKIQVSKFMKQ